MMDIYRPRQAETAIAVRPSNKVVMREDIRTGKNSMNRFVKIVRSWNGLVLIQNKTVVDLKTGLNC